MNCTNQLLTAHRRFNHLLSRLALGVEQSVFIRQVLDAVEELLPHSIASVLYLDSNSATLHSGANNHLPEFYNEAIEGVEIGEFVGSCGAAAYLNQTVIVEDINTHKNWQPYLPLTQKANLHACWSMPIRSSTNSVLGTFAIYHQFTKHPSADEQEILQVAAVVTAVAIEKKQLEEQLHFAATHDELTELKNRTYLADAGQALISLCKRQELSLSLLFIDLNNFKQVNDQLGHDKGDQLLIQVAKIILSQIRESDIAVRFGGDEFIVLMQNNETHDGLVVAKRIRNQLLREINTHIKALGFGVSIGIAYNQCSQQYSLTELINLADKAMYFAKQNQLGIREALI